MFSNIFFSDRLHTLRKISNVSQQQLADHLGLTKSSVSRMESAQRAASIEVIYQLAEYFDVSIDYLVGRTDNPKVNK